MSKTALLFAGQGAQTVGMGQDLAETYTAARALFDRANEAMGYDLAGICFCGSEPGCTTPADMIRVAASSVLMSTSMILLFGT